MRMLRSQKKLSVVTDTSQFRLRRAVLRFHNFFVSVTTDNFFWLRSIRISQTPARDLD